jgi:hypothetical protein
LLVAAALAIALLGVAIPPAGAVFDASVSPPRFELNAKPGEVIRQVVTISNGSAQPARYSIKTADWDLDINGGAKYDEAAPRAGSCRPWVRLERHEITVPPRGSRNYRFEIHVPPDTKAAECRFAFLVAGEATNVTQPGPQQIQIPIVGRVGIIVYAVIGDAKPDLRLASLSVKRVQGKTMPVATFANQGKAHGRVFGNLQVKDAAGHQLDLVADEGVILPGAQRGIELRPLDFSTGEAREPNFDLTPPMHVRGKLQYQGGGEIAIDQVLR